MLDIEHIGETFELVGENVPPVPDRLSEEEKNQLFLEKKRTGEIKKAIHTVTLVSIWVVVIVLICVFLIRVLHFIMPHYWHWLAAEDLQSIDKFLFSGAVGGIVSNKVSKLFSSNS